VEPLDTSQHPGQPNVQTHEAPSDPGPTLDPPGESLSDEPCALPAPGNSTDDYMRSIVHGIVTAHTDTHRPVPTFDVRSKEFDFEVAARRIDEIAKVIKMVISPSSSNHTSVLGAHLQESKVEGEKHHRTSEVVRRPPYSPIAV